MQQADSAIRSGKLDMIGGDSEAWARLRLVQGRSSAELWELVSARGHTMLTVGSGAGCSWSIADTGVAPIHFSLHWDGNLLRIADTHGAGNLYVDRASVGGDWQVLSGRVRIDFGAASIVVETSAGSAPDQGHPLDRGTLPGPSAEAKRGSASPAGHSDVAAKPNPKSTLLGVASLTGRGAPIMASVPGKAAAPSPPERAVVAGEPPATAAQSDSFRPKRPSDAARAPKPTLLGMVQSVPPPEPAATSATGSARPKTASSTGTLLGVGDSPVGTASRGSRAPSGAGTSLGGADQRTMPGFPAAATAQPAITVSVGGSSSSAPPGRRDTQRGVVSPQPGAVPPVAQARVRPVADEPSSTTAESSGGQRAYESASSEGSRGAQPDDSVPQAVMVGGSGRPGHAPGVDRLSDAPTEMRDVASLEPRRARRAFPWRYLGLGVLTVVAYVAWLYLLDHL